MSYKYTFLVPAYKTKYLKEALDSIMQQKGDFNVVVSDDCSPEDVKGTTHPYIDKYGADKVVYRRNETNSGGKNLVAHWNKLLGLCDSQYVIMASDDDLYSPDFLTEIDRLATKYPDADVIRARVQRINSKGEVTAKEDIFEEWQSPLEAVHSIFCGYYIGCIGNYVFRTDRLKAIEGFVDEPYAWFSDLLTVIATLKNGQANSNKILFSFRLSELNISNTSRNRAMDAEKLQATIGYDDKMSRQVSKWEPAKTLYERNLQNSIVSAFKHRAYSQAGDYSWSVPVYKWHGIMKAMSRHSFFSKGSFLKYFMISVMNRWLSRFAS